MLRYSEWNLIIGMIRRYRTLLQTSSHPVRPLVEMIGIVDTYIDRLPTRLRDWIDSEIIRLYDARIAGQPLPTVEPIPVVTDYHDGTIVVVR